jgi:cell division protein FtsA
MSKRIITGIDIGTYQTKVVIVESDSQKGSIPIVLGAGTSESKGVRHGYITNQKEVVQSIRTAISQAEQIAKVKVKKVYISVGGIGLNSITSQGSVIISRADSEITELDIAKAQEQAEKDIPSTASVNRKIVHTIPLQYKIDGKPVLGKPEGMKASKLEVKMLFITCLEHHLNDIIQCAEEAGFDVQDVMASPIAASLVTLSKAQKIAGCVLTNIGAETVSIAVFENNIPISLEVFDIGSTDITNDIALGLKVPLEEAEHIKIGVVTGNSYPRKKLEEIVEARLSDIFELIETHLKKIGRNGLLPAGVILTGGGSSLSSIDELAKSSLKLPAKIGTITIQGTDEVFHDATWAVAYGLCIFGSHADQGPNIGVGMVIARRTKNTLMAWIKQFLP